MSVPVYFELLRLKNKLNNIMPNRSLVGLCNYTHAWASFLSSWFVQLLRWASFLSGRFV